MGIGVLGPVVCDDGVAFGRRDRAVLTALALCVGRPVSEDRLAEAVWGEDPPRSAHKSLQGCVFRIRQALGSDVIGTSPQGYVLAVPADEVDSLRFERLVGRGRELLALGEPERAAYLLGEALDLWRGTAFEDLELADLASIESERLKELRREAEELRVEASLRTGRHLEVLATAEAMVREAPLRERRWQLLALAQYQAGRQTEALRTVHRVKAVLAEQLGIDPGPELAALEEAILRQDESLLAGGPLPTTGTCPYRGLLPYDLDDPEAFFGRDDDVRACLDIVRERGAVSVVGPSGSGKSSLARAGIAAALRLQGGRVTVVTPGSTRPRRSSPCRVPRSARCWSSTSARRSSRCVPTRRPERRSSPSSSAGPSTGGSWWRCGPTGSRRCRRTRRSPACSSGACTCSAPCPRRGCVRPWRRPPGSPDC